MEYHGSYMLLKDFIQKRRSLVWYTKNHESLSEEAVVEAVLNYGDWDDVQELISILGIGKLAEIFRRKSKPDKFGRQNYRPEIKHYFNLYLDKYLKNA